VALTQLGRDRRVLAVIAIKRMRVASEAWRTRCWRCSILKHRAKSSRNRIRAPAVATAPELAWRPNADAARRACLLVGG
jgi:hypothetical protein